MSIQERRSLPPVYALTAAFEAVKIGDPRPEFATRDALVTALGLQLRNRINETKEEYIAYKERPRRNIAERLLGKQPTYEDRRELVRAKRMFHAFRDFVNSEAELSPQQAELAFDLATIARRHINEDEGESLSAIDLILSFRQGLIPLELMDSMKTAIKIAALEIAAVNLEEHAEHLQGISATRSTPTRSKLHASSTLLLRIQNWSRKEIQAIYEELNSTLAMVKKLHLH